MNIVINLDKPENITSQQAVTMVKRLLSARKAGHAGTLDPMATGVLVVCLEEATKITRFLSDLHKEYHVRLKFGVRTDTYDITGKIIAETGAGPASVSEITDVLKKFTGPIVQVPPMFSAVKIDGTRLYKLARKGIEVERQARTIVIDSIDLLSFDSPYLEMKVSCSKGTYIRTLCDDIGTALGSGACMVALRRTGIGPFRIEDSVTIDEIGKNLHNKERAYTPIDSALSHLPEVVLDQDSYQRAKNGMSVFTDYRYPGQRLTGQKGQTIREDGHMSESLSADQYVRMKTPGGILFGIGKMEENRIRPDRLLN